MKKFLLGIVIGVVVIVCFIYFGGGNILKALGKKTIEVGEKVEIYEKALKEVAQGLIKNKEVIEKEIKRE